MRNIESINKFRQAGKIKILFCINSLAGGGAEKYLVDVLKRFDYEKYCVDLVLFSRSGVYLDDVPREVWIFTPEDNDYLANISYDAEIAFVEGSAVKYIARRQSDAYKMAWVQNDLYTFHWTKMFYHDEAEEAADYARLNRIVFVSEDAKSQFNKRFPGMEVPQTVLYSLIDADEIRRRAGAFKVEKKKLTLCCLGRLTEQKAYPRLINVIDRLVHEDGLDFELWIIGQGEQKAVLEVMIEQYSLEDAVMLKGFHKNPHPYMWSADIFLLPSLAEGFPLVLGEALSLGKPIMATDCAGPKEVLADGNCGMVVSNNEDAIYQGLKNIITNKTIRDDYACKALSRAKMFDVVQTMKRIYELLPTPNIDTEMEKNERILNHVILASAGSSDPGLLNGKMGIIVLLTRYSKSSGNELYKEMAFDMLDEVWEDVTVDTPVGLASGLCGVGWGIEYLIRNGFVDADADEVCEAVDRAVHLQKIDPEMDMSLDKGLEGILHYMMARISGNVMTDRPIPFGADVLKEMYGISKSQKGGIFTVFNSFYSGLPIEYRLDPVDFIPARIKIKGVLSENTLGFRGLTGHLFKQLS
jgi:glycosyltransferase involved in cell wall biosynthesis